MDFLLEWGAFGLFIAAFLAATILPFSSELLLAGLLATGGSPVLLVLVATAGNVLGSLVNYGIGYWGSEPILHRWLKLSPRQIERTQQRYEKWGVWSLLFAWVPIIGDPLTVIAGIMRVNLGLFLLLVTLGKFGRYLFVAYLLSVASV